MRTLSKIVLLISGAVLTASPAAAQQKNFDLSGVPKKIEDQLHCLYDPLMDDFHLISEIDDAVFATDLGEEEAQARISKALRPYSAVCSRVHLWNDEQNKLAWNFTLFQTVADLLYERLLDEKLAHFDIIKIDRHIDVMAREELTSFTTGVWRTDASFRKKMEARLKEMGVPEEGDAMTLALEYMSWSISAGYAAVGFASTFASN